MALARGTNRPIGAIIGQRIAPTRGKEDGALAGRETGFAGDRRSSRPAVRVQAAALPWRRTASGELELLLITSRGGNRWIVPKGWPMPRLTLCQAAAQEAYEEAGIRGFADPTPLGTFAAQKLEITGRSIPLEVELYALEVREELGEWPERAQRRRRWCSCADAAAAVEPPELKALIRAFCKARS